MVYKKGKSREKDLDKAIEEKMIKRMGQEETPREITKEESIKEKIDENGCRWEKKYFGGGDHFRNWLEQCEQLAKMMGTEIEVEEVGSSGLKCFGESGEKMYRIWMKSPTPKTKRKRQ